MPGVKKNMTQENVSRTLKNKSIHLQLNVCHSEQYKSIMSNFQIKPFSKTIRFFSVFPRKEISEKLQISSHASNFLGRWKWPYSEKMLSNDQTPSKSFEYLHGFSEMMPQWHASHSASDLGFNGSYDRFFLNFSFWLPWKLQIFKSLQKKNVIASYWEQVFSWKLDKDIWHFSTTRSSISK